MTFAISDRIDLYEKFAKTLERMETKTKDEVWEDYQNDVESWRMKTLQQKERLEALGVEIGS